MAAGKKQCPKCGARNQADAARCRICTAVIGTARGDSVSGQVAPEALASSPAPVLPDQPHDLPPVKRWDDGWDDPPSVPPAAPPSSPAGEMSFPPAPAGGPRRASRSRVALVAVVGVVALVVLGALLARAGVDNLVEGPAPNTEWRSFDDPAGRFVVDLPAEPDHHSEQIDVEGSKLTYIEWSARAADPDEGEVRDGVSVVILPEQLWGVPDELLLEAVLKEFETEGLDIVEKQLGWEGEYNYRTLDVLAHEGDRFHNGRLIYTGTAVFVIEGESDRGESPTFDRVLESFVLLDPDRDEAPSS